MDRMDELTKSRSVERRPRREWSAEPLRNNGRSQKKLKERRAQKHNARGMAGREGGTAQQKGKRKKWMYPECFEKVLLKLTFKIRNGDLVSKLKLKWLEGPGLFFFIFLNFKTTNCAVLNNTCFLKFASFCSENLMVKFIPCPHVCSLFWCMEKEKQHSSYRDIRIPICHLKSKNLNCSAFF